MARVARVRITVEGTGEVLHEGPRSWSSAVAFVTTPVPPQAWFGTLFDFAGFRHGPLTFERHGIRQFNDWPKTIWHFPRCER